MNNEVFTRKAICNFCGKERIFIDLMYGNKCVNCFIKDHSHGINKPSELFLSHDTSKSKSERGKKKKTHEKKENRA